MLLRPYLNEIRIFARHLTEWLLLLLIFTFFFFSFGIETFSIAGINVSLPYPTDFSFAVRLFTDMTVDLIPSGVTLIVTSPLTAFVAQIKIALLLSFICTLPFLLYRFIQYFSPALYLSERLAILKVAVPSAFLFALGAVFAYTALIPPTFSILYSYTDIIGATPFFSVNEFINLILALVVVSGIMFLLPICMALLTRFDIVPSTFWREEWRYAVIFFLVLSAIMTPDGSGVTMVLLSLPLAGLYGIGFIVSKKLPVKSKKGNVRHVPL